MMRGIILILVACFTLTISCKSDQDAVSKLKRVPKEVVYNFDLVEVNEGVRIWRLNASRAVNYNDTVHIYDVKLWFYNENGKEDAYLTADSGFVFFGARKNENNLIAMGSVKVTTHDTINLMTQLLMWDDSKKKIIAPEEVTIKKGNRVLHGRNFISNPDLTEMKLYEVFGETQER